MFVVTAEARDRQNAAIVAKSTGPLARMTADHWDYQGPIAACHGVTLRSDTSGAPLGSSIHEQAGRMTVEVQQASYQEAADRGQALAQLAERRPGGLPGQPGDHVAPTGVGARFRQNTPQAAAHGGASYLPGTIGGSFG